MDSMQPQETKSVLEHIGELKKKIFIALGAIFFGALIGHFFNKEITAFLLQLSGGQQLIFLSPLEPLFFIFKIDLIAGIIIAFPFIVWCLLSYIAPALPRRTSAFLFLFYIISTLLLIGGLFYAFLVTIPLSLKFLFSIVIPGVQNQISAQNYINFFITQTLIITFIFQFPLLIIGSVYLDILRTKTLANKRRYAYLIITIALAVITPTVDIFSLIVVLAPCFLIFEISLIGGKIVEKFKKKTAPANRSLVE